MRTMSSSTSSSDKRMDSDKRSWFSFCVTYGVSLAVIVIGLVGLIYVIDPYDTGRSRMFEREGVRPQGPRTAAPSRIRDPQFNAAIIGNSKAQILSPQRLDALSDLKFVQLTMPGTGPTEQLAVLDWYLHNHPGTPEAVVLAMDPRWCGQEASPAVLNPFPFWMFEKDRLTYTGELLRFNALQEALTRISYLTSRNPKKASADGYWDYTDDYVLQGFGTKPEHIEHRERNVEETARHEPKTLPLLLPLNPTGRYPALEKLAAMSKSMAPATALIIYLPPVYYRGLPAENSADGQQIAQCKGAIRQIITKAHAQTAVVDWWTDRPEVRKPEYFFDQLHYRNELSALVEQDIATAYRTLKEKQSD